jgi:hypothetical protein
MWDSPPMPVDMEIPSRSGNVHDSKLVGLVTDLVVHFGKGFDRVEFSIILKAYTK